MKLLPILFLVGCALDEPSLSVTEQAAKPQPGGGNCPAYGCGTNSPEVEGRSFWEHNELGLANTEGIRLVRFTKRIGTTDVPYRLDVFGAQILARSLTTSQPVFSGAGVVGMTMTFEDTNTGETYFVEIVDAETMPMWAAPPHALGVSTWSYELYYWTPSDSSRRSVCRAAVTGGTQPLKAVLFDDDRISPDDLRVVGETPNWFTIGCAGSALAKLHLTGHTKAGSAIVHRSTTLDQRTTFLKLLTADYCGTGHAFTVANVDLHYKDYSRYMDNSLPSDVTEAGWGPRGATCVNTPRVEFSPNTESMAVFGPSIVDELYAFGCTLPSPCTNGVLLNPRITYAISKNY
jgi:hypothetical protein